ncbi:hypothetical protein [Acinetobacter sp. FDAARGOS_724]|uniref:hypothetical protein n=1 Tax=Acinetobacter sp. FDAARGOS_724 TaxID=2545797 RepID=UPI001E5BF7F1|nr:hypothetical protein [Acinetobacter sp. FDAARGOS_724]
MNTNLVSKWIRLIDAKPGNDRSLLPNNLHLLPILLCTIRSISTGMLTVQLL